MNKVNSLKTFGLSLSLAAFLVGCGGGGGGTSTPTTTSYNVTGTVPGTIIEAYCTDGSYYKTTSIKEGEEHPFTLSLPKDAECKIVMITNETDPDSTKWIITPIEINSDTNLVIDKDLNLEYIDLPLPGKTSFTSYGVQAAFPITVTNANTRTLSYDPMDEDHDGIPKKYDDDEVKYDDDTDHDGIKDTYDRDKNNDEEDDNDSYKNNYTTSTTLPNSFKADDGRLLGSQCAQCHGTNGKSSSSFDSIERENNLYKEMSEYSSTHIMGAQAKGYTSSEATKMESWFNSL